MQPSTPRPDNSAPAYQLLPPLTGDERATLRESIETFGVLQPVVKDEAGRIIDGHHRAELADELGLDYPVVVVPGLSEEQKLEQALVLNLARRHLSVEQKRAVVATLRDRGLSVRWISEKTGIPRSTVGRMVPGVPSGTPAYVGGLDGKRYRAQSLRPFPEAGDLAARTFRIPATIDELYATFGRDPRR